MIKQLLLSILLIHATLAAGKGGGKINGPPTKKWLTLNGVEPVVVARGGFSGVAPDSSQGAFTLAQVSSLPSTILLCDLQLTKDGEGFCLTDINLCDIFPSLAVIQSVFSRTYLFDHQYAIGTPFDVKQMQNSTRLWINVQHPTFYDRRKLSPALYIEDTMQDLKPAYISSPEIGFLKALGQKVDPAATKLVLRLMGIDEVEPTTKEKYGSLLQKLPMIKTFASGIIVPKEFIWPVDDARILQPASNLVSDAHKAGLEVFAAGFANDNYVSYNYSYDPAKEYFLILISNFFLIAACLAQNPKLLRTRVWMEALIISHDGASGDYPGSSDLAYQKAIDDGVDIIDCSVQMSKDEVPFCSPNADLSGTTTATTVFLSQSTTILNIRK